MGQKRRARQLVEGLGRHGHGKRVAAIGGPVGAGGHALGRLGGGQAHPHRKAVPQRLGQGHDVGLCLARPFVGEQLAGAAETALDLVQDQQHAMLGAQRPQVAQAVVRHGAGPAFALHGLEQHGGGGRGGNGGLQGLVVAELHLDIAGQAGAEALHIGRIARRIDGGVGPAVERAVETDHVDPFRLAIGAVILAGGLQGAFQGLRPGIGEEGHIGEGGVRQPLGQGLLLLDPEHVGDVPQLFRLPLHRLHQPGMGVAETAGGDAGHAVQIFLAVLGDQAHASASVEGQGRTIVHAHQVISGDRNFDVGHGAAPKSRCPGSRKSRRGRHRGSGLFSTNSRKCQHLAWLGCRSGRGVS